MEQMNFRDKLDEVYSELLKEFKESDKLIEILESIDQLQNQIEEL
jgi:thymidylate kinase